MAKQTFTTGQVLTAAQMTQLQQTAMLGGAANARTASYTLTATDAGNCVSMSNVGATTITVNTGIFAEGDIVTIINLGGGTSTITAGTATVSKPTNASLELITNAGGILYFTSTSSAIFLPFSTGGGAATSNLASQDFTGSGTWTKPTGVTRAWVLLVGGGGAGGGAAANSNRAGGGGGGGMVKFELVDVTSPSTVTVTIGTGGTGGTSYPAADGGDSTFGALLTAKGGKGAVTSTGSVADQNGGAYSTDSGSCASGGGGGAGGTGGTAQGTLFTNTHASSYFEKYGQATGAGNSAGGSFKYSSANANAYLIGGDGGAGWWGYGGGGGGGVAGTGTLEGGNGSAGGGRGGNQGAAGGNAVANTGGGGGGASGDATNRNGGNGGSGFCRVIWVA
jgi:hypothetical protein